MITDMNLLCLFSMIRMMKVNNFYIDNIVSKGTYRMAEIKQLFANCFIELSKFCEDSINHQRRYTNWNSGEKYLAF